MKLLTVQILKEALEIATKIEALQTELVALMGGGNATETTKAPKRRGRPAKAEKKEKTKGGERQLSEEARQKIAEAQKKRWAKAKRQNKAAAKKAKEATAEV